MNGNIVNIMSDSKSDTYFTLRMDISLDSYLPHIDHDHLVPEVIPLSDDSDSERVPRNSLDERVSPWIISRLGCLMMVVRRAI